MLTAREIYDVLDSRRIELYLSQAEASKKIIGRSDSAFFQGLRRGSVPSASRLSDACDALGLEFYFGPIRDWDRIEKDDQERIGAYLKWCLQYSAKNLNKNGNESENPALAVPHLIAFTLSLSPNVTMNDTIAAIEKLQNQCANDDARWAALEAEIKALREAILRPNAKSDNYDSGDQIAEPPALYDPTEPVTDDVASARPVSVMELAAAAGGGALDLDERVVGQVWFRRDWLDRKGIDSTQCNIISVKGESMEPTLPDGCSILVDRSRQRRHNEHIFVLLTADGLVVKRLDKDDKGRWQLLSDHPDWEAMAWQPDTTVVGEVMWVARSL